MAKKNSITKPQASEDVLALLEKFANALLGMGQEAREMLEKIGRRAR